MTPGLKRVTQCANVKAWLPTNVNPCVLLPRPLELVSLPIQLWRTPKINAVLSKNVPLRWRNSVSNGARWACQDYKYISISVVSYYSICMMGFITRYYKLFMLGFTVFIGIFWRFFEQAGILYRWWNMGNFVNTFRGI